MYKTHLFALALGLASLQVGLVSCGGDKSAQAAAQEMTDEQVVAATQAAIEHGMNVYGKKVIPALQPVNKIFAGGFTKDTSGFDRMNYTPEFAKLDKENIVGASWSLGSNRYLWWEASSSSDAGKRKVGFRWMVRIDQAEPVMMIEDTDGPSDIQSPDAKPTTLRVVILRKKGDTWEDITKSAFPADKIEASSGAFMAVIKKSESSIGAAFAYSTPDGAKVTWEWKDGKFAMK